ncbi:uncharacterized protein TNCV_1500901 [Trichonephila clavipes]|uniref:Uncharacterized protein n=1 Tax=Trichonephila clavipes TaxID=2585209 RepID=A0A8X6RSZ9_TRICX|nr:uncharacterized protein TNCV_1500901 [Trichonephila clavipes]
MQGKFRQRMPDMGPSPGITEDLPCRGVELYSVVAQTPHMDMSSLNALLTTKAEVAAVAEWYRYRTVACRVTSSSPVPLKTRRVGQRCTLNLSRAQTSSRWCGVVVRRGGASSGVIHVT